jgi:uncharacterized protein (DUF433 family)
MTTPRIVSDPNILSGKPRLAGTRISVEQILEDLAGGLNAAQVAALYDGLTAADVQAAVAYAIGTVRKTVLT